MNIICTLVQNACIIIIRIVETILNLPSISMTSICLPITKCFGHFLTVPHYS